MDVENKKEEKIGFFEGISLLFRSEAERRRKDKTSMALDAIVFFISFLFARCHIIFGSYPLAISFVAVLPSRVSLALIGAVIGSLSMGRGGVIYSVIVIIVVFLRVLISGVDKKGEGRVIFSEPLVLRIASGVIGAFVGAIYEILLSSLTLKTILFSAAGVLLSALFTFLFSGIFDTGIGASDFLFSKKRIFSLKGSEKERFDIYVFQGSLAVFIFLVSIALKSYNFFGISPAYIYSSIITLVVTKRFGIARGVAVGFISSFGISSVWSVGFSLMALGAGLLYSYGITYALVGAGAVLSFWSAYAGGVGGVLTVLPEFVSGALLSAPILRKLEFVSQSIDTMEKDKKSIAEDMVFASAATYKNSSGQGLVCLSESFMELSRSLKNFGRGEGEISYDEYRDTIIDAASGFCAECPFYERCVNENPAPYAEIVDIIATKVYKNEKIFPADKALMPKYCENKNAMSENLVYAVGKLEEEKYKNCKMNNLAELYNLNAELLCEAIDNAEKERRIDAAATEKLKEIFLNNGLYNGDVKVYGERVKRVIGACEDKDGSLISAKKLHDDISSALGIRIGVPQYFRKGEVALFEASSLPMYSVDFATVGRCSGKESVTGDTAMSFESADGRFYSLISDGMGSGPLAHKVSNFTSEYFSSMLGSLLKKSTVFHLLNHILRSGEECPTTVDLFEFDLMNGDGVFYKCGAATSYVKRENSIFRIKSETAPVGAMKNVDAERIRVEIKKGDVIIMLSDGVAEMPEDSAWLLELLNKPAPDSVKELANRILDAALANRSSDDDISISVIRVCD